MSDRTRASAYSVELCSRHYNLLRRITLSPIKDHSNIEHSQALHNLIPDSPSCQVLG